MREFVNGLVCKAFGRQWLNVWGVLSLVWLACVCAAVIFEIYWHDPKVCLSAESYLVSPDNFFFVQCGSFGDYFYGYSLPTYHASLFGRPNFEILYSRIFLVALVPVAIIFVVLFLLSKMRVFFNSFLGLLYWLWEKVPEPKKWFVTGFIVIAWFSWFYRFEHVREYTFLDRWTGTVINGYPYSDNTYSLFFRK